MNQKYIVYMHTSPSGKSYVGYTKHSLKSRWEGKIKELRNKTTPLAHALRKYPPELWTHQVLGEYNSKQEAHNAEKQFILEKGDYNLAAGGSGGNTGRNNDPVKKSKQAKSLSRHWRALSEEEKQRRIQASLESRKRNGTLGNNQPRYGEEHGNWNGYWVVSHKKYRTLKEAAAQTGLNPSTILDLCVRQVDQKRNRNSALVEKGKTPRECGHYKTKGDIDD